MTKIADEATISVTTRQQLELDRRRAAERRDHHFAEAKRWDALLARIDGLLAMVNEAVHQPEGGATPDAPHDLRAGILALLREHQSGLKPIEVTHRLHERGFRAPGKTSLPLLVSNMLWRMEKKAELVTRTRGGAYRIRQNGTGGTE